MSRSGFICIFTWRYPLATAVTLAFACCAAQSALGAPVSLRADAADIQCVRVVLEVTGHLLTKEPEQPQSEAQKHPLKALGNLQYEERLQDGPSRQGLRYYDQAQANIEVDGRSQSFVLRDDRRWIRASASPDEEAITCPQGGLTRAELDLLEVPAGTHLLSALTPDKPVDVGDRWVHDEQLLARLFNLEQVTTHDVESELKSIAKGEAKVELSGQIVGSVHGVITELKVKAKYSVDLRQRRITWIAVAIQEDRSIGLGTPGLQVTARLRMVIGPATPPQHLLPDQIAQVDEQDAPVAAMLEYRPEGQRFVLRHARHWHVLKEQPRLTVLRWVDDGQFVAQCNLVSLPPRSGGKALGLSDFQKEIRRALGESAEQVVDAQEIELSPGVRTLRVVVAGQVADAPIQWIYYHLTHDGGDRLSCVFTMGGEELERFGGEDLAMAGNLMFLQDPPEPVAAVPSSSADSDQR